MKKQVTIFLLLVLTFFGVQAMAVSFDTDSYDSDVTNYILEVHERLLKSEIQEEDFKKLYGEFKKSPTAETLASITADIMKRSQKKGKTLNDQSFVLFVHKVVLGQFSLEHSYSRDMVNEDLQRLDKGSITQQELLQERLTSELGMDHLQELAANGFQGDILVDGRGMASEIESY